MPRSYAAVAAVARSVPASPLVPGPSGIVHAAGIEVQPPPSPFGAPALTVFQVEPPGGRDLVLQPLERRPPPPLPPR